MFTFVVSKSRGMSKTSKKGDRNINSEEKIKEAAKKVFYKKGYAATRTRDIAEEAGINLALLNYYFRSKSKLFELILVETLGTFIQGLLQSLNDSSTTLDQKLELVVSNYTELILKEPEIPIFIMTEMRNDISSLFKKIPIRQSLTESVFFRQLQEEVNNKASTEMNPFQILINMMSMIIFPFLGRPIIKQLQNLDDKQFEAFVMERKKFIPAWVKSTILSSSSINL